MSDRLYSYRTRSVIEDIKQASTSEIALKAFEEALAELGVAHFGVHFLPRPKERLEDVCIAWRIPPEWRELYLRENFCQADPAFRYARRTVLPFDWESAPYNPETEPRMKEMVERARDFDLHKGIAVPIPSPNGIIGIVGVAGPHFVERELHKPLLQLLSLHVFHRLQQLICRRGRRTAGLTDREREVLAWAAEGKTAWEIGCILSLSQRTVETYFDRACKKLGAINRIQAVAICSANSLH
jgi:LuxR family transcriptional regulator, quorum-sensing system regulator BjaR1